PACCRRTSPRPNCSPACASATPPRPNARSRRCARWAAARCCSRAGTWTRAERWWTATPTARARPPCAIRAWTWRATAPAAPWPPPWRRACAWGRRCRWRWPTPWTTSAARCVAASGRAAARSWCWTTSGPPPDDRGAAAPGAAGPRPRRPPLDPVRAQPAGTAPGAAVAAGAGRGRGWGYGELLGTDIPASQAEMDRLLPSATPVVLGGDSLGGQLACCRLALAPGTADALWLVASGAPYWRTFPMPTRAWLP